MIEVLRGIKTGVISACLLSRYAWNLSAFVGFFYSSLKVKNALAYCYFTVLLLMLLCLLARALIPSPFFFAQIWARARGNVHIYTTLLEYILKICSRSSNLGEYLNNSLPLVMLQTRLCYICLGLALLDGKA